jgi:hypothetical protein
MCPNVLLILIVDRPVEGLVTDPAGFIRSIEIPFK